MVVRNWWKDSCKIGYQVRHRCEQSFAERIVLRILTDDLYVTDEPALIYFQLCIVLSLLSNVESRVRRF